MTTFARSSCWLPSLLLMMCCMPAVAGGLNITLHSAHYDHHRPYHYHRYHHYHPRVIHHVHPYPPRPLIVERPVYIEEPIYVERPVVVQRQVIVERPVPVPPPPMEEVNLKPIATDAGVEPLIIDSAEPLQPAVLVRTRGAMPDGPHQQKLIRHGRTGCPFEICVPAWCEPTKVSTDKDELELKYKGLGEIEVKFHTDGSATVEYDF